MSERLEIKELRPGVDVYTVFDERTGRSAVAGWYEVSTRMFHKFANSKRHLQRKVGKKWLRGFGIQENAFLDLQRRGCQKVRVHYAPRSVSYTSDLALWGERGLMADFSGLQRFLGIFDLATTHRQVAAEKRQDFLPPDELSAGRQMAIAEDVIPDWFVETGGKTG